MNITNLIGAIKLLCGSHSDVWETGQGSFMNVIAYLNGEPQGVVDFFYGETQITDASTCVCFVVRPTAIWLNDYMTDEERPQLIRFIERAMVSATDDKTEIERRLRLVVSMAYEMSKISAASANSGASVWYATKATKAISAIRYAKCARYSGYACGYACGYSKYAEYNTRYAKGDAGYIIGYAAGCAARAAEYADAVTRKKIIAAALSFLDQATPKTECSDKTVIERAVRLRELVTS